MTPVPATAAGRRRAKGAGHGGRRGTSGPPPRRVSGPAADRKPDTGFRPASSSRATGLHERVAAAQEAAVPGRRAAPSRPAAPKRAAGSRAAAARAAAARPAAPKHAAASRASAAAPSRAAAPKRAAASRASAAPSRAAASSARAAASARRISAPLAGRVAAAASAAAALPLRESAPAPRPRRAPAPRLAPAPKRARRSDLPLGARFVAWLRALPDHHLLERLIGGRTWIVLVGTLLVGLVTLQLSLLKLNAGIGTAVEKSVMLEQQNAALRGDISRLSAAERITAAATQMGLVTPPQGSPRFIQSRRDDPRTALHTMRVPAAAATGTAASTDATTDDGTTATTTTDATDTTTDDATSDAAVTGGGATAPTG